MELEKTYEPAKHEAGIYKLWEESGAFKPAKSDKPPFSIILPPPNANGDLHLGHAMYVVEDIMIRWRRMLGHPTLWLPGADHAGIETQIMYERELAKSGRNRFDLGREKFYNESLAFTRKNTANMVSQIKSLGFSVDWSRFKFTLDADIVDIVYDTFKQMHDDGLIYRGNRIVNWCTNCLSSFADIEIKYEGRDDHIYTLDYGSVKIATTRPETIFADVAVAVHPDDERYTKLVGRTATVPLVDRPVPIIADQHVDPKTGTGALKVTPGHDTNDFDIGLRHDLPQISVIDLNGEIINAPEELLGLGVVEARQKTLELLKDVGALVESKPLRHAVGTHGRCGTVIEPLITEQWWLKVEPLTLPAIKALESGEVNIVPSRFNKVALDWLRNLHDWNISRQNWWGIRIPVYYKTSNDPDKDPYIIAKTDAEAEKYYGRGNFRPETDTFDTWFSSGQWPFATLMATGDYDRFYPTSVMETGRDILFLWVTRMIMLGLYRTGKVPFRSVYLHGLVNDEQGKKMSKSKGNGINPLDMTAKYGTDAVRLALTIGITPGNDGSLGEKKIEGYRNFCNKLWNVSRFVLGQLPAGYSPAPPQAKTLADGWILDRLSQTVKTVTRVLERYRFSDAGQAVYSLLWNDFADWYVEASKVDPNNDVLVHVLETILKLLHPFAPFVTEAIWQILPWQSRNLITESWPEAGGSHRQAATDFEQIKLMVGEIRNLRTELQLGQVKLLHAGWDLLEDNADLVTRLAGLSTVETGEGGLPITGVGQHAWLDVDLPTIKRYEQQLTDRRRQQMDYLHRLEKQLADRRFVGSAPKNVVAGTRERRDQSAALIEKLDEQIAAITRA